MNAPDDMLFETFLVFSDYSRPAIRLSAIQNLHVIYEFTHDSFYVGEDGPTHQPVEHLMAMRGIPGLHVHRPADATETVQSWMGTVIDFTNCSRVMARVFIERQTLKAEGKRTDKAEQNKRTGQTQHNSSSNQEQTWFRTRIMHQRSTSLTCFRFGCS